MYVNRGGFFQSDLYNKRTGVIVKYLGDAEMLEKKAVHGHLLIVIVLLKKVHL